MQRNIEMQNKLQSMEFHLVNKAPGSSIVSDPSDFSNEFVLRNNLAEYQCNQSDFDASSDAASVIISGDCNLNSINHQINENMHQLKQGFDEKERQKHREG